MVEGKPYRFLWGQRSSCITGGHMPENLVNTIYLKLGNLDGFHTWYGDVLWLEEKTLLFLLRVKANLG